MIELPRLYAVVDAVFFATTRELVAFAEELAAGGCTLMQYRNKKGSPRLMLEQARELKKHVGEGVKLIMNDRVDLCLAAGFDGVHVGQEDLSPEGARAVVGDRLWVGVSTHSGKQVRAADKGPADYLAIGPVFATSSKQDPDPVVGLKGVRMARESPRFAVQMCPLMRRQMVAVEPSEPV